MGYHANGPKFYLKCYNTESYILSTRFTNALEKWQHGNTRLICSANRIGLGRLYAKRMLTEMLSRSHSP